MNFNRYHILFLIILLSGWVGIGAATVWGSRGLFCLLSLGAFWGWGVHSNRPWVGNFCLLLLVLVSLAGVLRSAGEMYFIAGMIAALAVWDLQRFYLWLESTDDFHHKSLLIRRHLMRLGWVFGGSLLLLGFAFRLEFELTFWYAIPLIGLVLIGIHRLLHYFKS